MPNTCWSNRVAVAPLPKAANLDSEVPAPAALALVPTATELVAIAEAKSPNDDPPLKAFAGLPNAIEPAPAVL